MNSKKLKDPTTFKILSIDGGGIKGLYSATLIKELEKYYDCKMMEKFDMICGTSTGGLIAMALASEVDIDKICDLYQNKASKIFAKRTFSILPGILFKSKYKNDGLRSCLNEIFNNKTLGNTKNLLCIPSYSVTNAETVVFKNRLKDSVNSDINIKDDNHLRLVDVALATSAAPTYFPMVNFIYRNKDQQFIDGGVWANNPSMVGMIEALNYFVKGNKKNIDSVYEKIQILSISSLTKSQENDNFVKADRGFSDWGGSLFDVSMKGNSDFNDYFLNMIESDRYDKNIDSDLKVHGVDIQYFRIPSPEVPKNIKIEMDSSDPKVLKLLKDYGQIQFNKFKDNQDLKKILESEQTFNFQ